MVPVTVISVSWLLQREHTSRSRHSETGVSGRIVGPFRLDRHWCHLRRHEVTPKRAQLDGGTPGTRRSRVAPRRGGTTRSGDHAQPPRPPSVIGGPGSDFTVRRVPRLSVQTSTSYTPPSPVLCRQSSVSSPMRTPTSPVRAPMIGAMLASHDRVSSERSFSSARMAERSSRIAA
jgi:hypothetical protein